MSSSGMYIEIRGKYKYLGFDLLSTEYQFTTRSRIITGQRQKKQDSQETKPSLITVGDTRIKP